MNRTNDNMLNQDWHPDLTEEQIYFALSKNIYEPKGREYEMFLAELGLEPIKPKIPGIDISIPKEPGIDTILGTPPKKPGIDIPSEVQWKGPKFGIPIKEEKTKNIPSQENNPFEIENIIGPFGEKISIQIPKGFVKDDNEETVYIPSIKEIEEAAEQELKKDKENIVVKVRKKRVNKLSKVLAAIAITSFLASGFKLVDKIEEQPVVNNIVEKDLEYDVEKTVDIETLKYQMLSDLNLGDKIYLKKGLTLNTNSLLTGVNKTIGKEFNLENKHAGDYALTGFSIVSNGEIIEFIENFDNSQEVKKNLGVFISETLNKHNLTFGQVDVMLHFGSNLDLTRTGWINQQNIVTESYVHNKIVEGTKYSGEIDNFDSDYIIINVNGNNVKLRVTNSNGELLENGTKVIGSDGNEYELTNLELIETTKEIVTTQKVVTGKRLTYDIRNCDLLLAALPMLAALAFSEKTKKENEKAAKDPYFTTFETIEEYNNFKEDFRKAKQEFDKKSALTKFKKTFVTEKKDEMQILTTEQKTYLLDKIQKTYTNNYVYNSGDKIEILNGKIIVTTINNEVIDITSIVMPGIHKIAAKNEVIATGILTDELKEGKHR